MVRSSGDELSDSIFLHAYIGFVRAFSCDPRVCFTKRGMRGGDLRIETRDLRGERYDPPNRLFHKTSYSHPVFCRSGCFNAKNCQTIAVSDSELTTTTIGSPHFFEVRVSTM